MAIQTLNKTNFFSPLKDVPDVGDIENHSRNMDPVLITERLRELVPLLDFIGFSVDSALGDHVRTRVPLLDTAMNQNGTQQASVFYLLMDYTLGIAMVTSIPGVYVTGVHDRCPGLPVQLWLMQGSVKHLAPGTGEIVAEAHITKQEAVRMRSEMISKGRTKLSSEVRMFQNGEEVAIAEVTVGMYVDLPRAVATRVSMFQKQNHMTSALMIAGLKDDEITRCLAGPQGQVLANRFSLSTPQLPGLVSARSRSVQRWLQRDGGPPKQVLILGVGFDTKAFRIGDFHTHWYGIDLQNILDRRTKMLQDAGYENDPMECVAADLRTEDWPGALLEHGFDPAAETAVVMEGLSMYLTKEALQDLFSQLCSLMKTDQFRVWMDHVQPDIYTNERDEVRSFLSTMNRLGEPFITAFERIEDTGTQQLVSEVITPAAEFCTKDDEVYNLYLFSECLPS